MVITSGFQAEDASMLLQMPSVVGFSGQTSHHDQPGDVVAPPSLSARRLPKGR